MKIAVIGSRGIQIPDIEKYLPKECSEIVSGGAIGVDTCAANFARERNIPLTEFLPLYKKYGRAAPIVRNKQIVEYADEVIAFWDGKSRGTFFVIQYCKETGTPCKVVQIEIEYFLYKTVEYCKENNIDTFKAMCYNIIGR